MSDGPRSGRIVGRYALYDEIAAGGMATVHIGRLLGPVGFARTVAIKRLHAHFAKDPEFVAMFLDEARLAARIRHPNVVSTHDVVALEGELFLVMDYAQGESLSALMRAVLGAGATVPPRVAVAIMVGALHGLHAAHQAKSDRGEPLHIVHRDVSPQNIIVGTDGIARVLDFGVAKASGRLHTTREGVVKGKLGYMSPEQLRSQKIDGRADVYSAAVVLWEALAGQRLFVADSAEAVMLKVLEEKVVAPSAVREGVPRPLDAVVMKGLHRDVGLRFANARAMALELERVFAPATATEVGTWVEVVAADVLARRARQVAQIESASTDAPDTPVSTRSPYVQPIVFATPTAVAPTGIARPPSVTTTVEPYAGIVAAPSGATDVVVSDRSAFGEASVSSADAAAASPPAARRGPRLLLGVMVLALGVAGIVAFAATRPAPAQAIALVPVAPSASPATEVPASASPSAVTAVVSGAPPLASAPPSSAGASPRAATAPVAPRIGSKPRAHPTPSGGCDPPYTINANGFREPKPECLK